MASVIEKARRIGRRGLVVLSVTATMAISGVAFASWTLEGTGTGTADAAVAATLTSELSVPANLYPDLTTDASITITNPNDFPVTVTQIAFTGALEVTPGDGKTCTDTDSAVTFNGPITITIAVPAKAGEVNGTATQALTGAVTMGADATDGCQGASFSHPITLTANITAS